MAEAFFRQEIGSEADITVSSAGVSAMTGTPASSETIELVEQNGCSLAEFTSTEATQDVVDRATHIFCLTKRHARSLLSSFPELKEKKIYLVGDFIELEGKVGRDIPDPFGMGPAAYREVASVLKKAVPNLVTFVRQTESKS